MTNLVRRPVVAGTFYYHDSEHLKKQLEEFFSKIKTKEQFLAVVSPHAGYEYSGMTAAHAIGSLKPANSFIILGPNHNVLGPEFSVMGEGQWETPLGKIGIDQILAKNLLNKCKFLKEDKFAHVQEHSIEVQLPFLQYKFKESKFVPISIINTNFSDGFLKNCEDLGKTISVLVKNKKTSIIASSDFSHYIPFNEAKKIDSEAIKEILKLDTRGFFDVLKKHDASICGYGPITVLMAIAKNLKLKAKLIDYTSSGEVTGDLSSVVTYAAIGFG